MGKWSAPSNHTSECDLTGVCLPFATGPMLPWPFFLYQGCSGRGQRSKTEVSMEEIRVTHSLAMSDQNI